MVRQRQRNLSESNLTKHFALSIHTQRDKLPHLPKRLHASILIGSQHRDERPSFSRKLRQKFSRHSLAVHNDSLQALQPSSLLITSDHGRQASRQMLVSP